MGEKKIKISAVKYANTYPFLYGMYKTGFDKKVSISTDHPADCASRLIEGDVDIGLIPIAALPLMKEYYIITDFCLGAYGKVRTVMLLSNCSFNKIERIYLDYRSRSSVNLARILAKYYWKKTFIWAETSEDFNFLDIKDNEALVLIGDQCFEYENRFSQKIDLAEEWYNYTGLPFAFACWTANKKLEENILDDFNAALKTGVENIPEVVKLYRETGSIKGEDLNIYLTKNMDFHLTNEKRKAIELFLRLMDEL